MCITGQPKNLTTQDTFVGSGLFCCLFLVPETVGGPTDSIAVYFFRPEMPIQSWVVWITSARAERKLRTAANLYKGRK